jgi:uncharacterized protein
VKVSGRALRLSIFVSEGDTWRHRPAYAEIVHRAHGAGLAGATVLRGVEGYGSTSIIHTAHVLPIGDRLPLLIMIIDNEQRIRDFLPRLDDLEIDGLVTLDEVEVVRYLPDEARRPRHRDR